MKNKSALFILMMLVGIFIFQKYFQIYQNTQNTRTENNALIIMISSAVYITIMLYALYREKQRIKFSKKN